jgi:hypothetical protein
MVSNDGGGGLFRIQLIAFVHGEANALGLEQLQQNPLVGNVGAGG